MFFSCEDKSFRSSRKVFSRPETSVKQNFLGVADAMDSQRDRRSSVRVNYSDYEGNVHKKASHQAFQVLSNMKRTDPVLRQQIRGSLSGRWLRRSPVDYRYDNSVAGGRLSKLIDGNDADSSWKSSSRRPYDTDCSTTAAGLRSQELTDDVIIRDQPGSAGKHVNAFSARARGWDGRNAIITNDHPQPSPFKLKKHFQSAYEENDHLGSDLIDRSKSSPAPTQGLRVNISNSDNRGDSLGPDLMDRGNVPASPQGVRVGFVENYLPTTARILGLGHEE